MAKPKRKPRKPAAKGKTKAAQPAWPLWAAVMITAVAALRLGMNALDLVPVHFDEGQYWAYGHELAAGHFSKPPLVGWVIYAATQLGGDTTFWLRIASVLCHAIVAALIFATGRRLFDGQTGFWAAAGYTVAPGVTASALIMSTDPVMMAAWALALYAWVRAAQGARAWWAVLGIAIGLGMLAKYTMAAFAVGALGYGLFSARGRDWRGVAIASVLAVVVLGPNLIWQLSHDFATARHVAEDAAPGGSLFNLGKMAEFVGAQLGVIGPIWFLAILGGLIWRGWGGDWRLRLLGWQTYTLLLPIIALAFVTRSQPNWAAPAYIAGSIFAARYLLTRDWRWALPVQAGLGALAAVFLYAAAFAYDRSAVSLPRGPDPFKKMRLAQPFCARALGAMAEEGAEVLLSDNRRRLSECMFLGTLGWQDIAVWNPGGGVQNHHQLVASLGPGDDRPMVLAVLGEGAGEAIAQRFEDARLIETDRVPTHANRDFAYTLWSVRGFKGY